jgi:hypothetical protein
MRVALPASSIARQSIFNLITQVQESLTTVTLTLVSF